MRSRTFRRVRRLPIFAAAVLLIVFARPHLAGAIVGIPMIVLGEMIRIWAAGHIQKNEVLTVTGPYNYVKNPLYIGTILCTTGYCIWADNIWVLAFTVFMYSFHYIPYKLRVEGGRLLERFGPSYADYDAKVPDYIPRWTPYSANKGKWSFKSFIENSEEGILLVNILAAALVATRPYWDAVLGKIF